MIKFILVFGMLINANNIAYLRPAGDDCNIVFIKEKTLLSEKPCDVLAAEIVKQSKFKGLNTVSQVISKGGQ